MNIILAHGILGFDKIGPVNYFNGIKEHLQSKYNVNVLTTHVSPTGSIEERGRALREQILAFLENETDLRAQDPDQQTHIIAHSMGGLDSRYILSPDNPDNIAEFITSLTTVGTPHRGSPIADLLYPLVDGKRPSFLAASRELPFQSFLDLFGQSTEGLRDLTTTVLQNFNNNYQDNPGIYYFWTAGIGREGVGSRTSMPFSITYRYLYHTGKTEADRMNDGVVPLSSASYGEQIGRVWLADHADEVGHNLTPLPFGLSKPFPYLERYDEIIARISRLVKPEK
jgi:triacylglycerol lipase